MLSRSALSSFLLAAVIIPSLPAQEPAPFTELAQGTLLFATPAGNVVAAVTPAGAFVVGPLSLASTGAIQAAISRLTSSPVRYVIAGPRNTAQDEGDGGWGRLGAMVATHESAWDRMADSARLAASGAERPKAAFSQVLKFHFGGHEVHAVHQQPGYSDADVLVHFETTGVVYLGESLAGDGYPAIDSALGGTLGGLLQTLNPWTRGGNRIVPARGPALTPADVLAFRNMLVTMRDRVAALRRAGRTLEQVIAAQPSREFDARWGSGRVTPEAFVRQLYRAAR